MKYSLQSIVLGSIAMIASIGAAVAVEIQVPTDSKWEVIVRGFVATDFDWDQHDLGGAEPFLPAPNDSAQVQNRALRFSASQSQFGFYVQAPPHDTFSTDAYLEMDFLKGVVDGPQDHIVSATPRLRLAYAQVHWNNGLDTLTVGQTYILFGDLYPDQTFDNLSLALGTVLGREPQIQYVHLSPVNSGSQMISAVSINAPNSGLFNEDTNTAETSGVPFVHAKIGFQSDTLGKADYYGFENHAPIPAEISLSGFIGREKILDAAGTSRDVDAWGAALNGVLPIVGIRDDHRAGAASIDAQVWIGQQMDGYFGGNGQGVYETQSGHVAAVRAHGYFVEAKYFLAHDLNLNAIYSTDNNDLNHLTSVGIPFRIDSGLYSGTAFGAPGINKARNIDVALWYNPFDRAFVGAVWDDRKAIYNSGPEGSNNRVNLSMFYNF